MASARSNARLIRFGVFTLFVIFCVYILTKGSSYPTIQGPVTNVQAHTRKTVSSSGSAAGAAGAGAAVLPISRGKVKATFVTLARNFDIYGISDSIMHIENRFNKHYNYDWVFFNDEPFSEEFMAQISALVSGTAKFAVIPKEQWSYPAWIDKEKAALVREEMGRMPVPYGESETYRHMCRFNSGFFFRHELLADYEYYWRVEPDIKFHCDIDYDVFQYMKDNDKWYGWTISLPEYEETIPTLWQTTQKFLKKNPSYVAKDNNMAWISSDRGESYNGCHFWSNFEIGRLDFWKSEAYMKYFEFLDKEGGFYYERWGDAPVHSIAASLLMPKSKLHYFDDLGYFHVPFTNCPVDAKTRAKKKCTCKPEDDSTWRSYSCTPRYFTLHGMRRPKGWENFTS